MKILKTVCVAFVVILGIASAIRQSQLRANAADAVSAGVSVADRDGHLHVPDDYRTTYQLLGSWAIAADDGRGSKELHVVHASPGVIDAYRRDKRFPDGAVLVKEVFKAATSEMTTGSVSRADDLKGWFVMVKDTANSHPKSTLWGDGWGWCRRGRSLKNDDDELQGPMSGVPCARADVRLGLRGWIPSVEAIAAGHRKSFDLPTPINKGAKDG
jgi:hypothetical protein